MSTIRRIAALLLCCLSPWMAWSAQPSQTDAQRAQEAAERARQQAIGRDALATYRDAAAAHAALAQQAQDQLEAEIAKNEQDLVAQGRSCLLNDDDVVRLRGNAQ